MKRLSVALAALLLLVSQTFAAGTISFSLSQQLNTLGKPLANCSLQFYQAGTVSTPQNAFKDTALTLPHPNPLRCDAAGRLPQFFLADGQIKIRLTDANGIPQVEADNILVIGPSSGGGGGGGGGGSVDPTTVMATGDVKAKYGTGSLSGFVRLNGRTIGSSTSGATERANSDTQALFEYLWNADVNLAVSTGRGGSANADWVANKTIALPDFRSRALAGLGDMGNSDNALFAGVTFTSGTSTTLGALLGAARRTLTSAQIPAHTHPNTLTDPGHTHTVNDPNGFSVNSGGGAVFSYLASTTPRPSVLAMTGMTINNAPNTGGGNPFDSVSPFGLVTLYVKL